MAGSVDFDVDWHVSASGWTDVEDGLDDGGPKSERRARLVEPERKRGQVRSTLCCSLRI